MADNTARRYGDVGGDPAVKISKPPPKKPPPKK